MKNFLLTLMATFFLLGTSFAQEKATAEQRAENYAAKVTKEYSLSAEQQQKVQAARLTMIKQMDELDAKYGRENRKEHKDEYKPVHDSFKAEMKQILTPDQFSKWEVRENAHVKRANEKQKMNAPSK